MFKLQISSIFNLDRARQSWISGVLGVSKKREMNILDCTSCNMSWRHCDAIMTFQGYRNQGALASPIFQGSVNPIPTRRAYFTHSLLMPPLIFFTFRHHCMSSVTHEGTQGWNPDRARYKREFFMSNNYGKTQWSFSEPSLVFESGGFNNNGLSISLFWSSKICWRRQGV